MSDRCQQHTMYDPTCPQCQWGTKTNEQSSLASATGYLAPACDADTAERELCEALDKIYKRYGSLGAFFDELQKRRPVQENIRS